MSHPASMHDSYGFLNAFFKTKKFLLDFHAEKFLLDYAHNITPYYQYWNLTESRLLLSWMENAESEKTKTTLPLEKMVFPSAKPTEKWITMVSRLSMHVSSSVIPLSAINTIVPVTFRVSPSKYGKTVHLTMKDNPRFINVPPRDNEQ